MNSEQPPDSWQNGMAISPCQARKQQTPVAHEIASEEFRVAATLSYVFIVGDSILKNLQGRKISRSAKVKVSSFPRCCTTIDMRDHIKPTLRKNPDAIVIHVVTNSLRSSTSVRDCAEEIANLATMIGNESSADLAISGIIPRSDDESVAVKVPGVNKLLKTFGNQNGWGFVDHSNISPDHDLNRSGLHLNTKGTARLATNFINYLRDD